LFLSIKKLPLSKKSAKRQSETTARLADNLTNISNIKYFAREKYEKKQFNKITQKLATANNWDWGIAQLIFTWQGFLSMMFEIAIFCVSIYLVANQKINLGQLVLIQLYIGIVINNLWRVPQMVRNMERAFADSNEMTEILFTEPEIKDAPSPIECKIREGLIEFKNVTFDHKDSSEGDPLFEKLTFTIKPGEKVGLAGPSGGGKTTLTKLILRMSDIDSGMICIDGQDISKLRQSDLRESITYVPQEPILFHRTLLENISYGNTKASLDDCVGSAIQANADQFISKLKDGYDTLVGERGVKLSGGQRQRVAIARAMLKDAPILLLDEATSALDSGSEKLIQDALWKLMQDRTALVIAHRLSTIQKLDRILVIDDGRVVEEGTHQALLEKNGLYAKLWAHQSGGFIK
jgi:ATP-binding cassette subfamily B protein